jgi:hypothetical protein
MVINSNGNVGIGTSSPGVKLDVIGGVRSFSSAGNYGLITNGSFQAVGDHGGTFMLDLDNTGAADLVNIKKSGTSRFYIKNDGNIGIGTTSPKNKLSVIGSDSTLYYNTTAPISVFQAVSPSTVLVAVDGNVDGYYAELKLGNAQSTYYPYSAYIRGIQGAGIDYYRMEFGTANGSAAATRMTIATDGNIGIGTTTSAARLHIYASGSSVNLLKGVTYNNSNASFNNASLEYYDTSTVGASTVTKVNYNAYFNKRGTSNITGYTVGNFNGWTQIDSGSVNLVWDYSSRIEVRNQATASSLVHFIADAGYVTAQGGVLGKATDRIGLFIRSQNQSALTLTNQYGIYVEDLGQSTNNYAFYSNVSAASNKYNIYVAGSANNYFAGNVGIGTTSPMNGTLQVYNASGNTLSLQKSGGYAALMMGSENNNYALIESLVNGGIRFYTGDGTLTEKMRITSTGDLLIGTTTSPSNAGISLGATGTVRQLLGGMENTSWRIRERDQIDALAITTNINDSGTQDSSARSSWKLRMGWGNGQDNFVIARSPVASNSFSDLFYIKSDGNVGIGTTAPVAKLDIRGGIQLLNSSGSTSAATSASLMILGQNTLGGSSYHDFLYVRNTLSTTITPQKTFRLNNSGSIEIVNNAYTSVIFSLTDAGVLSTTGGGTSDIRTKQNIEYIYEDVSTTINKLKPAKFEFKNNPNVARHGFIAQDVLPIKPELVLGDGDKEAGTYGLDYDGILALTVKALQEANIKTKQLENKIETLEARLSVLENK